MPQVFGVYIFVDFLQSFVDYFLAYAFCRQSHAYFHTSPTGEAIFIAYESPGEAGVVDEAVLAKAGYDLGAFGSADTPTPQFFGEFAFAVLGACAEVFKACCGDGCAYGFPLNHSFGSTALTNRHAPR